MRHLLPEPARIGAGAAAALRTLTFDQRMASGVFALMALLPIAVLGLGGGYLLLLGERAMIFALAALSLELLIGVAGLVSFGHAAFLGIGAYAAGMLASHGHGTLVLALPIAIAASALFALATGAIAVRTRGVYFIMITLAFGQMAFFVATSLAPYGGDDGLTWPTRTLVLGTRVLKRVLKNEWVFYYVSLACLVAAYVLAGRLIASRFGRVLRGLTDNERRMEAIGFAPYSYRLTVYILAGATCGLAGFLLGNQVEFVSPAYMHWQRSGELILMVLLGGSGTLYGPIIGALAYLLLEEGLSRLTEHWKVILGPLLVLLVLFGRGGIAGAMERWRRGELTVTRLRPKLDGLASAATARAVDTWRSTIGAGSRLLDSGMPVMTKAWARAAARWRHWNMALGEALVSLVLLVDRSIARAFARRRRR
jgi:branched-chain amino acid transport system permease protein